MSIVYAYADNAALAAESAGFCKQAGAESRCFAFSPEEAETLSTCGFDRVILLEGAVRPVEQNAQGIADYIRDNGGSVFLVGATPQGRDLAARVAAFMDCAMASDVASLEMGEDSAKASRTMYGGSVVETSELAYPCVVTAPAGLADRAEGSCAIETASVTADGRVEFVSEETIASSGVNLHEAKAIVAIGMGINQHEDLAMIEELAETLGAGISCTRGIAEERHWLPAEQYVGLSGEDVAPDLYITFGISGQAQHVAGIRGSKIIAAVNTDANAPIFRAADYGIIGDLYQVVPALTKALKEM